MPRPLSNDLRKRLIRLVESGMSARAAGARLDIAASTATGIVKDWRDRGSYEPLPTGGWLRPKLEDETDFIEQLVADHPANPVLLHRREFHRGDFSAKHYAEQYEY